MSFTIETASPPLTSGGTIQVYAYEPFSYRFVYPTGDTSNTYTFSNTSVNLLGYLSADTSGVTLTSSNGYVSSSSSDRLILVSSSGATYSNSVFGGSGRFLTSLPTSNLILTANQSFTPIQFFTASNSTVTLDPTTANTQPTLPQNLQFVGTTAGFFLQGLPVTTTANSNYLFIASNSSNQVVSTPVNIQVVPERVQLFGGPAILSLTVGVPIRPVVFTATMPQNTSSNFFYSLPSGPSFPSGLYFTDICGYTITPGSFYPADPSGTLILTGTPTIDTPTAIGYGSNSITTTLKVQATSVYSGVLTASTSITASYTETVVFSQPANNAVLSTVTVGLALPTNNAYMFNAESLFGMYSAISTLYSPDLRSDLSLNAVFGTAYLTGTPTFVGSNTFTATAVSQSGISGSIRFSVVSSNDILTLTPFADTSLNFIIGRPLSNTLPGYYSSNLTLTSSSSANQPMSFLATGFTQGGITSKTTANTISFTGVPTTLIAPTIARVSVSDGISVVEQTVGFAVLDDVFTWPSITAAFEQNSVATPIQLNVTTLSGRVVISYTTTGLPSGITCTRSGLIRGTCLASTGGTFIVTASTGISTQQHTYSYTIAPDALLLTTSSDSYTLTPGLTIPPIVLTATSHSGLPITNLTLVQPSYGFTLTNGNVLTGTLYSGYPPYNLYSNSPITINALIGTSNCPASFTLTSTKVVNTVQVLTRGNTLFGYYTDPSGALFTNPIIGPVATGTTRISPYYTDTSANTGGIQVNEDGNVIAPMSGLSAIGSTVFGSTFYGPSSNPITTNTFITATGNVTVDHTSYPATMYRSAFSVAYSGSGSTWYALGTGYTALTPSENSFSHVYLLKSDDNGQTWTPGYTTTSGNYSRNWALAVKAGYESTNTFLWGPGGDFFYPTLDVNQAISGSVVLKRSPTGDIYMAGGGTLAGIGTTAIRFTSMTEAAADPNDQATIVPVWEPVNLFQDSYLSAGETRDFALEGSIWVAAGSSTYGLYSSATWLPPIQPYFPLVSTLQWSADQGATWSRATANDFGVIGIAVTYGARRWLALGQDLQVVNNAYVPTLPRLKVSINGKSWTNVTFPSTPALRTTSTISFINSQWIVNVDGATIYVNSSSLPPNGWTAVVIPGGGISRFSSTFSAINPYAGNSTLIPPTRDLSIQLLTPSSYSFTIMQFTYMTSTTLTLNRSPALFFLDVATLPLGISFDPVTGVFSGMALAIGKYTIRVTAKSTGSSYNYFDFTFNVFSPYPTKRQDMASAYTAYVRQEAIIAGAQFSRDSNALPSENTTVGAAMGPMPPEVESAPQPCCK